MRLTKLQIINLGLISCLLLFCIFAAYAVETRPRSIQWRGGTGTAVFIDATLRESAILTNSYVATDFARVAQTKNLGVWFDLEQGSLTSFQYKVQWSRDSNVWFDEVTESVTAGVITDDPAAYTLTFVGDDKIVKPIPNRGNYVRLMVKGTGTVTSSVCIVYLTGLND